MRLRPLIFWPHLAAGVFAGLVILTMSATGVLLTYERQIVEWAEQSYSVSAGGNQSPLTVDELLDIGRRIGPGEHHFWIRFVNRPGSPITIWAGDRAVLVNPYTGDILREGEGATADFFHVVEDVHRWLAVEGEGFDVARATTAVSNLSFLFLMFSGIYLWLPRVWRWPILKTKLFFNPKASKAKARDFNWHHVFSAWAVVPLLFICLTATVFYFPWANSALYAAYGEEVPNRDANENDAEGLSDPIAVTMSQQALFDVALDHARNNGAEDWYSIWMEPSVVPGAIADFYVDRTIGHQPVEAYELTLDGTSGDVLRFMWGDDYSPGDQARDYVRYLHTGEVYGIIGQTIAGLASLAACLLVYTGLALVWRRLISQLPLTRHPPNRHRA